jgi:serine/threonine-protein kinase ATR
MTSTTISSIAIECRNCRDSSTKSPPPKGDFAKWVGVSDEQEAQYIVRSFLVLSAMDVDRAYLNFFNDKDEPQLHATSGITRNFKPKPSFYAMSHLYRSLGVFLRRYHAESCFLGKIL